MQTFTPATSTPPSQVNMQPCNPPSEVCMQSFIANLSNELKNYPEKGRESPHKFFCRCGEFLVVLSFSFLSEFGFCVRKLFLLPAVLEPKCRVTWTLSLHANFRPSSQVCLHTSNPLGKFASKLSTRDCALQTRKFTSKSSGLLASLRPPESLHSNFQPLLASLHANFHS